MSEYPPPTVPPATPPPPGGGSYTPPPGGSYPPPPPPVGGAPSSDRTIMLVLSYIGILSLIPFFLKKDDAEVQWHAKNGVALFATEVVVGIIFIILSIALRSVACGLAVIRCVVWLGFVALSILCIVKAVGGQRFRIPVVTDFAEKL